VNQADMLDRALEKEGSERSTSVRALVAMANEVAEALGAVRLPRAEQDRIYARSLAMLEEAVREQRRGWQRVLHLGRPAPVLVGGAAALTIGAAAIGWAVVHGRRSHAPIAA
jgi:hypothetical protein